MAPKEVANMNKLVFAALLVFVFHSLAYSQQQAQFSHNMFNNMGINPGFAGMRNAICATALARQQWVGLRDEEDNRLNPETYTLNVDAPIPWLLGGVALGFIQDRLGYETNVGAKISYSYHTNLDVGRLGIGAQVGFLDKRIDFSNFNPISPGDPALIGGAEESHMFVDFALGGFYQTQQSWAGLSVSQLRQARAEIGGSSHQLRRHMYLSAGHNFPWQANPSLAFQPSVLVKTDMASVQIDINTLVLYNNRFWGGVSYRPQDAVVFLMGFQIDQIRLGYSFDLTTSPLSAGGRAYGSHEIMLQYCFQLDIDRIQQIQRNIRFL
jgi:type IX secretion system PorP/SprF family membrane protein